MKKILAMALVIIVICLCAVSCKKDGAPDGMIAAHKEGEPFLLYVPEGWTVDITGGVSGAYYAPADKIIVTARYYTPSRSDMTLDEYVTYVADSYLATLTDFNLTSRTNDVLGGSDARRITYTMTEDGVGYSAIQISAAHKGDMVSLNFYATGNALNDHADGVNDIISNFTLCDKAENTGDCVTDKKTPEGMKIASSDALEYRFYVPLSWICSTKSATTEAYYPESERTNVNVSSYSPDTQMTLAEFADTVRASNAEDLEDYELLSSGELLVAGKNAISDTFSADYDGQTVKLRQVMLYSQQSGLFYIITYTATDARFDEHMADFDAMLAGFTFR